MKKLITSLLFLLSVATFVSAEDVTLPMIPDNTENEESTDNDDPDENIDRKKGHRIPPRPINCTISTETGISIPGVETSEIISFELYDESGELCFASFNDEMEFVSFLFSLEGEYVIRFVTENKSYTGYINL